MYTHTHTHVHTINAGVHAIADNSDDQQDTTNATTISAGTYKAVGHCNFISAIYVYNYVDVQPAPAPESHDPTATSEKQPQPPNDTNEQQDVPTSNDGNTKT